MKKREILKEVNKIIKRNLSTDCKVVVFGSTVAGNALSSSDLDIGILCKEKVDWGVMTKMMEEVEAIPTLREIDLVDLNSVEENFRENALKNSKELDYAGDI